MLPNNKEIECPICGTVTIVGKLDDENYFFISQCSTMHAFAIIAEFEMQLEEKPPEYPANCRCTLSPENMNGLVFCGNTPVQHTKARIKGFLHGFDGMGLV